MKDLSERAIVQLTEFEQQTYAALQRLEQLGFVSQTTWDKDSAEPPAEKEA